MIKAYQEVTDWEWPNHTYLVEDKKRDKMIGMIRASDGVVKMFTKPMTFSKAHRKFKITIYSKGPS